MYLIGYLNKGGIEMYSDSVMKRIYAMIAEKGFNEDTGEIFEIARWSEGGEEKLELIGKLLCDLEQGNVYRLNYKNTHGGDYNPTYLYLERRVLREKPTLILRRKYRWVRICSTTTQYWTYPLGLALDNLTDTEYKLLSLIKDIQDTCDIPAWGDPYANTINKIKGKIQTKKDGELFAVPNSEYLAAGKRLANEAGKSFDFVIRA
jgi:hypothetical protein